MKTIYEVKDQDGNTLKRFKQGFKANDYMEGLPKSEVMITPKISGSRRIKRRKHKVKKKLRYEVSKVEVSSFKYYVLSFGGLE